METLYQYLGLSVRKGTGNGENDWRMGNWDEEWE